jgi:hypothetical protein
LLRIGSWKAGLQIKLQDHCFLVIDTCQFETPAGLTQGGKYSKGIEGMLISWSPHLSYYVEADINHIVQNFN